MIPSTTLARWRDDPIEQVLIEPQTKTLFELLDAERAFLKHAFAIDADGGLEPVAPWQTNVWAEMRRSLCSDRFLQNGP